MQNKQNYISNVITVLKTYSCVPLPSEYIKSALFGTLVPETGHIVIFR